VVSTRSVDGHTGWLINDDQVIVFVDNTDRSAGHGRFVAVGGMRDNLAVLDDSISAGRLAVDADQAVIECGPLLNI
jgi:acyl-CoA hydrolase